MNTITIIILLSIMMFICLLSVIIIYLFHVKGRNAYIKLRNEYNNLESEYATYRIRSKKGSDNHYNGKLYESIAMLLPDFPADFVNDIIQPTMAGPVDYIIWKGFNNPDMEHSITFLDIKTGVHPKVSRGLKYIKEAIKTGNINMEFYCPDGKYISKVERKITFLEDRRIDNA